MSWCAIRPVIVGVVGVVSSAALAVLPATPAHAAISMGPTAIAVGPDGTTYVGFAGLDHVARYRPGGGLQEPLSLPWAGAVDALAVDPDGDLWVSQGYGVTELSPDGERLGGFVYDQPAAACPTDDDLDDADDNDGDDIADPSAFGGLAVSDDAVYVSRRCEPALERYGVDGELEAAIVPPAPTRGLAYAPAAGEEPAKLYAAIPALPGEDGVVWVLDADFTAASTPLFRMDLYPPVGGVLPRPSGVTIDADGMLAVADEANHSINVYDTTQVESEHTYLWTAVLGHPSDPGDGPGELNRPTALAQYPLDGALEDLRGHLFIADTGNLRIQRWETNGLTHWAVAAAGAPVSPAVPGLASDLTVGGTPQAGQTLTCGPAAFSPPQPPTVLFAWQRDGVRIPGVTSSTFELTHRDVGTEITCTVVGAQQGGFGSATSPAVTPSPAPSCAGTPGVVINGGAAVTTRRRVDVVARTPVGADVVELSARADFAGAVAVPVAEDCGYSFALSGKASRTPRTVYARFTGDGFEPTVYDDSIVLDNAAPVVGRATRAPKGKAKVSIRVVARDVGTGLARMEFAASRGGRATARRYDASIVVPARTAGRYAWVRVRDKAGNLSAWVRVTRR